MKIMIDPGHGGKDPGASANGLVEKDLTLRLAKAVKMKAESSGFNGQIRLTRDADEFISLSKRADMANSWGADYFLSYHFNAGGGTGVESYSYTDVPAATDEINKKYYNRFVDELGKRDRGYKRENFAVVRETRMPALLVENLFLDHDGDAAFIKSSSGFESIVDAHRSALLRISNSSPPPASASLNNFEYLAMGSEGNDVRLLQIALDSFGCRPGAIDGIFGDKTEGALERFQRSVNIGVDGIFGPQSFNSMLNNTP